MVKLYVEESGSGTVRRNLRGHSYAATSMLSYTEARSAFSRKHRDGDLTADELRVVVDALDEDIPRYDWRVPTDYVCFLAGELTESGGLRAYDAVHLATAISLAEEGVNVTFLSFDLDLWSVARAYLQVVEGT